MEVSSLPGWSEALFPEFVGRLPLMGEVAADALTAQLAKAEAELVKSLEKIQVLELTALRAAADEAAGDGNWPRLAQWLDRTFLQTTPRSTMYANVLAPYRAPNSALYHSERQGTRLRLLVLLYRTQALTEHAGQGGSNAEGFLGRQVLPTLYDLVVAQRAFLEASFDPRDAITTGLKQAIRGVRILAEHFIHQVTSADSPQRQVLEAALENALSGQLLFDQQRAADDPLTKLGLATLRRWASLAPSETWLTTRKEEEEETGEEEEERPH